MATKMVAEAEMPMVSVVSFGEHAVLPTFWLFQPPTNTIFLLCAGNANGNGT